jgi:hypothetical protein
MGNSFVVPQDRLQRMRRIKQHLVRDDLIIARKAKTLENIAIQRKIEEETKQSLARIDSVVKDPPTKEFTMNKENDPNNKKGERRETVVIESGKDISSDNEGTDDKDDPPVTNETKIAAP